MEIQLNRRSFHAEFTKGLLVVDGKPYYTIEDAYREVDGQPVSEWKIFGKTAIPRGRYEVKLTYSPKFKRVLPQIMDVPGFSGIRLHPANRATELEGCVAPGMTSLIDGVGNSVKAMNEIQPKIAAAIGRGEKVWITIV